jgi:hypothetical protein
MLFKKLQSELLVASLDSESSMAYVSAIREVAVAEKSEDFKFDRESYETLAATIAAMAQELDGDFGIAYRDVVERVRSHALSLS